MNNSAVSAARAVLARMEREQEELYQSILNQIDISRAGVGITCPSCSTISWVVLPATRKDMIIPLTLACPKACGFYGDVMSFSPKPLEIEEVESFDTEHRCKRDGTVTRVFGRFLRCPFCAYENCREIMHDLRTFTEEVIATGKSDRDTLADLLARIVGTFDGVMRACNAIALRNFAGGSPYGISAVQSFQNLAAARTKMLPYWDMASVACDWDKFVLAFQKRHCFAHTLGVVDQAYVARSGDTTARVGQNVKIDAQEVVNCAREAENIVSHFFGHYLS